MDDDNLNKIPTLVATLQGYITDPNVTLDCDNLRIVYTDNAGKHSYIKYVKNSLTGDISGQTNTEPGFNSGTVETIAFKNVGVKRTITLTAATDRRRWLQERMSSQL